MTQQFLTGQRLTADLLNALAADVARDPFNIVSSTSDSGTVTSTAAVSLTLPSATYKAGKAYEVWVGGGIAYSVATAAFSSWTLAKGTTTAGATVCYLGRHTNGATTALEMTLMFRAIFTVGAADVTTQLNLNFAVNGSNTAVHKGSTTGNPRHLTILPAGDASKWSNMPVLS